MTKIREIKAFEVTISETRENSSETERAAILVEIAKINSSIEAAKYLNGNFFADIFIPDEFCELKPLK